MNHLVLALSSTYFSNFVATVSGDYSLQKSLLAFIKWVCFYVDQEFYTKNQEHYTWDQEVSKTNEDNLKYQPSGTGDTRSPPATPHRLQNTKKAARGPQNG